MAEDDDEMLLMTRSLNVMPKTTQHLIVLSDKSVACLNVTNNKRLRSTVLYYWTTYWRTRSIARPLCASLPPAFNALVREVPVGISPQSLIAAKTRMVCPYPMVSKVWRYVEPFRQNTAVWQTDRRTDGRKDGRTDILRQHSPRYAWHRAVKNYKTNEHKNLAQH